MKSEKPMTRRESILGRLIKMKQQAGEITRELIMSDPLLDWYEIGREFGGLERAKKQVKQEMKKRGLISEEEFKKQMRAAFQQNKKEDKEMGKQAEKQEKGAKKTRTCNRGKNYTTPEEVWNTLLAYAKELGDVPKFTQIQAKSKEEANFPCAETVRRHLGTDWREKMRAELFPETIEVTLEDDGEDVVEPTGVEIKLAEPKEEPILPEGAKPFHPEAVTLEDPAETEVEQESASGVENSPEAEDIPKTDDASEAEAIPVVAADEDDLEPDLIFCDEPNEVPGTGSNLAKEHIETLLKTLDELPPYIESWKAESKLLQINFRNGGTAFVYICAAK